MTSNEPILKPHHLSSNRALKITACSVCKTFTYDKLKVCGRCKTVYYCSIKCQRVDYERHVKECFKIAGNGKLKHKIDEYIKTISISDIPCPKKERINGFEYIMQNKDTKKLFQSGVDNFVKSIAINDMPYRDNYNNLFGYVIQIKDTTKFFESCAKNLNVESLEKNNMIYKSFIWDNCSDFVFNYMWIMKMLGINTNGDIWMEVFGDFRKQGIIPIVIYCEDLRHSASGHCQLPDKICL